MTFGERLKQIRTDKGMTTKFFAAKVGICMPLVYKYEMDAQQPSLKRVGKICRVLKMTPEEFMKGVEL